MSYERVTNTYHTPYLLSLANMPRMISEFEIVTNQTFLVPLQQTWSFVPGSASAQVAIFAVRFSISTMMTSFKLQVI